MKIQKLTLSALLFALVVLPLAAAAPAQAADTWTVDTTHSGVAFDIRHFLSKVPGRFNDFDGVIFYDPENPAKSTVEFTVQAASIDTGNENRDEHLRGADFFEVETYPTLTFKSKKVAPAGENALAVTGDFTLHGVTKEITVPVQVLGTMGDKAGFATEFVIDRKDYGINWNRALDAGGAILGDEVNVEIQIEANRKKEEAAAEG